MGREIDINYLCISRKKEKVSLVFDTFSILNTKGQIQKGLLVSIESFDDSGIEFNLSKKQEKEVLRFLLARDKARKGER